MSQTLIQDTETEHIITELIQPIANAAQISNDRLKIHIINNNDFNAFVMGGEDIYIYTGLLKQINSPDALQAVIAHELGHTIGGHITQMSDRMRAEIKRTLFIQALGIGLMVAGGNPTLGVGVLAGATGIAKQSLLSFSRDEERIADDMGIDLMIRAKLNPYAFIDVLEQMNTINQNIESKINPNNINHPLTTERLKNIREKLKILSAKKIKTKQEQIDKFAMIQAKLIGYLDTYERVNKIYPPNNKSNPAIYARAIADMQNKKLADAKNGVMFLIKRDNHNPYFYELLGDIEYQYGNYNNSINAYKKSLQILPSAPQIETALALVLSERNQNNDRNDAITLCKKSLLREPAPLTYWVLARAYGDETGQSYWAMAEYYNMIGKNAEMKKYAKLAKQTLSKKDAEYVKSNDLLNQ